MDNRASENAEWDEALLARLLIDLGGDGVDLTLTGFEAEELDALLEHAFERYYSDSGLFGSRQTARATVERVRDSDVDEIACLIDFGMPSERVISAIWPAVSNTNCSLSMTQGPAIKNGRSP